MPKTPIPAGLQFNDNLLAAGDAQRGMQTYSQSACIGCHRIRGNPSSVGTIGPELTHVGSRLTIAAGLFPNDAAHLARWIKNARKMKPGVFMNTLGKGEYDPIAKIRMDQGALTDEQIADIVAYLRSLK
jgi:cytochrome c oxidase subunit 2